MTIPTTPPNEELLNCNTSLQNILDTECIGNSLAKIEANTELIESTLNAHCAAINAVNYSITLSSIDLQTQIGETEEGTSVRDTICPIGGIVMYQLPATESITGSSGALSGHQAADITTAVNSGSAYYITSTPAWQVCNGAPWHLGSGTTPDLKGKFVISVGDHETATYTYNATGGDRRVTLTTAQMPAHSHSFNYIGPSSGTTGKGGGYSQTSSTTRDGNTDTRGSSASHNNVPQYHCLLFIQRIT